VKYDWGTEAGAGGGAGADTGKACGGSGPPSASWMDGNDCRGCERWASSSPEVLRDSGGDSNPPSAPGSVLAGDDWWPWWESGCNGLMGAAEAECLRW
jgi:hypothetical protein